MGHAILIKNELQNFAFIYYPSFLLGDKYLQESSFCFAKNVYAYICYIRKYMGLIFIGPDINLQNVLERTFFCIIKLAFMNFDINQSMLMS